MAMCLKDSQVTAWSAATSSCHAAGQGQHCVKQTKGKKSGKKSTIASQVDTVSGRDAQMGGVGW